ncbi:TetR/AcrR family transcriptional regulator [Isoptericola sp. NPDC057559]|uniref:TetR/AcrR family transcriptional regulator n=1 Tax=Isoptericola sp. NPDC057559 TaxID=3346168 RepID=UPI0036A27426
MDRPLGLREHKKVMTRSRIEHVAIDLCLQEGYGNVTVEQICEASEVSKSTFFNYFGTKARAALGAPPYPSEMAIKEFLRAEGNLLEDLIMLTMNGARESAGSLAVFRRRTLLLKMTPELHAQEVTRFEEAEAVLTNVVLARLRSRGEKQCLELVTRARIAVTMATSILRNALEAMQDATAADWDTGARESIALARRVLIDDAGAGQGVLADGTLNAQVSARRAR